MRWFRLFVGLLFGLSLGVTGCTSEPPQPTIDAGILAAVAPACSNNPVAGTGVMTTSGAPINHLVLLDKAGQPFDMTDWLPTSWRPASLADTELVACVTAEPTRTVLEVCPYIGSDITRLQVMQDFTVVEPSSGRGVASFAITADPRGCFRTENASLTELEGIIDMDVVTAHLAGLVEHGRFVDPDAAGASAGPSPSTGPGATAKPSSAAEATELRSALASGLVSVSGTGDGLQQLDISLTSEVDRALEVTIEVGTLLEPRASGTQRMVVVAEQVISLAANATETASLDVACVEMHQDQPTGDDTFRVLSSAPDADLVRLIGASEFADADSRVQQFAVWTITNNPKRNGYVGLGSTLSVFGSGPSDDEIDAMRTLFEATGIDTGKYRALR